jgi:hypothetical protein
MEAPGSGVRGAWVVGHKFQLTRRDLARPRPGATDPVNFVNARPPTWQVWTSGGAEFGAVLLVREAGGMHLA